MSYAGYGLPGRFIRNARSGEECDHCACEGKETPATTVIQGETDSFGHEELALCDACNNKALEEDDNRIFGTCEWCQKEQATLLTRDPDEGSSGPVYRICTPCDRRMMKSLADEEMRYEAINREIGG
jgi:hypothetical protein